jgi:hypothetical protein
MHVRGGAVERRPMTSGIPREVQRPLVAIAQRATITAQTCARCLSVTARSVRFVGVAAALASAVIYFLIGIGVAYVGEPTAEGPNDLLGFGLVVGTTFVAVAVLLALVRRRWVLAVLAVLDAAVILGYFAIAGARVPSFEAWGLSVKVLQLVLLVCLGFLLMRRDSVEDEGRRVRTGMEVRS